ncbi:MAG: Ethanolamine ammonia-lyase light chain [Pseudomonadota bacterium]|jgi:ethanolamine ammonia-lyase small subunit
MSDEKQDKSRHTVANPWHNLRRFTPARIALGRAGISLPTEPQLQLQMAHAQARDAVHQALDVATLQQRLQTMLQSELTTKLQGGLQEAGLAESGLGAARGQAVQLGPLLSSAAGSRTLYLQRPDLGRRLDATSREMLQGVAGQGADVALVLADGLSALALETQAVPFLQTLLPRLLADGFSLAPLTIVQQGRVAIGDEVGHILQARCVVVLIGERPGLSSPDSMGLYLTWTPRPGLTDESRNCISNVRPAGLSYLEAAHKLHYLLQQARQRELSGVLLKDESSAADVAIGQERKNFLLL